MEAEFRIYQINNQQTGANSPNFCLRRQLDAGADCNRSEHDRRGLRRSVSARDPDRIGATGSGDYDADKVLGGVLPGQLQGHTAKDVELRFAL